MKSVRVRAANLKSGDVIDGQRIKAIHKFGRRVRDMWPHKLDFIGVLVVAPNPNGRKLDTFEFRGGQWVIVKRPKYNMGK